jgi:hypothetical protein
MVLEGIDPVVTIYIHSTIIRNRLQQKKDTYACFIDLQKAFNWVDRDLLFYKLLENNIDGKIYKSIKALYNHPIACIKLNSYVTDTFPTESGVKQGDALSPTLFALFINDLVTEIKALNIGIHINEELINILIFADDLVILAENESDLQKLLDFVTKWTNKWKMKINKGKTKVVHFRNVRKNKTSISFFIDNEMIEIVNRYNYLGITLDEHLNFNTTANTLCGASGRALGGIISKFNTFNNIGFQTYTRLYHSGVGPGLDYCSGI